MRERESEKSKKTKRGTAARKKEESEEKERLEFCFGGFISFSNNSWIFKKNIVSTKPTSLDLCLIRCFYLFIYIYLRLN